VHGATLLQLLIHKLTSTAMLCNAFLLLYIFHVCLARLKVHVSILFHTHSSQSNGYVYILHTFTYILFLRSTYEWIA